MPSLSLPLPSAPEAPSPRASGARLVRLVDRVQRGDVLAFEELYRLTRDDVARALGHLVGRRPDLDQLVQETYLRLLRTLPTFRSEAQRRTCLHRVCATVALRHLRWWRRRREDPGVELPEVVALDGDLESAALAAQAARLVHRALARLSPGRRVIFVFHELCGLGPEEIALAVGAPDEAVRARLHQARLQFTTAMRELTAEARP